MRLSPTPRAQRLSRSALICIFYGGLLAVAFAWGALRGNANVFVSSPTGARPLVGAALGLALGLGAAFVTRLLTYSSERVRRLHTEFHALVQGITGGEVFLLALLSSVAEEAFFRGALQPTVGLCLQSLLFAALHFRPNPRFYAWTVMSFIVGLALGSLARYMGDLSAPIVAHFTINFVNLRYISRTELRR